jgi:hypothetical protein
MHFCLLKLERHYAAAASLWESLAWGALGSGGNGRDETFDFSRTVKSHALSACFGL